MEGRNLSKVLEEDECGGYKNLEGEKDEEDAFACDEEGDGEENENNYNGEDIEIGGKEEEQNLGEDNIPEAAVLRVEVIHRDRTDPVEGETSALVGDISQTGPDTSVDNCDTEVGDDTNPPEHGDKKEMPAKEVMISEDQRQNTNTRLGVWGSRLPSLPRHPAEDSGEGSKSVTSKQPSQTAAEDATHLTGRTGKTTHASTRRRSLGGDASPSDPDPTDTPAPVAVTVAPPCVGTTTSTPPSLPGEERRLSDLVSSEEEPLLPHRPDFYSILSDEDSFVWTFHNEKFSDLDIKFIPRVEQGWSDTKARASVEGNVSVSPTPVPEELSEPAASSKDKHKRNIDSGAPMGSETAEENVRKKDKEKTVKHLLNSKPEESRLGNESSTNSVKTYDSPRHHQSNNQPEKHVRINTEAAIQSLRSAQDLYRSIMAENKEMNTTTKETQIAFNADPTLRKKYRPPSIRNNVVFFQSSPTLTYKKTKLSFLTSKSTDSVSSNSPRGSDKDQAVWSSKARLSMAQGKATRPRRQEMTFEKMSEVYDKRRVCRSLCTLDEVESRFISNTSYVPQEPQLILADNGDVNACDDAVLASSSLASWAPSKLTPGRSTSEQKLQEDHQTPDLGRRRSSKDIVQWILEGKPDEGKLKRQRFAKEIELWKKGLRCVAPRRSLANWKSSPSGRGSTAADISALVKRSSRMRKPLEHFRRWARLVRLMLRAVGLKPKKPETSSLDFLSWTVVYDEVLGISRLNYDSGTLTFDPDAYKANRESTIRPDIKELLRLPPDERSDAQVKSAMMCLHHVVPAFSEFPVRVQQSMIKVCRHEEFEAGRVIIRQGHRAENFYFLLSGSAVVTVMDSGENHVHTANLLGKGSSFGDLAFLNMAKRSATVTCRDNVEVLCIERDDFINIFLRGVQGKEPAHFTFLRGVDILKGWPVQVLPQDNPKICAYTYVRRGVIVSHDSATCEWIVVIVSGSCKIIKAMRGPPQKGQGQSKAKAIPDDASIRDYTNSPTSSISSTNDNNSSYSNTTVSKTVRLNDGNAMSNTSATANKGRASRNRVSMSSRKSRQRPATGSVSVDIERPNCPSIGGTEMADDNHLAEIQEIFNKKHVLPAIKQSQHRKLNPAPYTPEADRPSAVLLRPGDGQQPSILRTHRLSTGVQPPALPQVLVVPPEGEGGVEGVPVKDKTAPQGQSGEKVFIEVASLEGGDVFGLEHVLMGDISDVTSCSLVSAGAEVVLINRKFFLKHMTEETAKDIREKIRPLPSEASLRAQLKTQLSWQAFKADMFSKQTHQHRHVHTPRHNTNRPSFGYRTASQIS